jgi:tetratricopeptide (TPR) repeat protein
LEELAKEAEARGFIAYHRPDGSPDILKNFISQGLPVIIRTWLEPGEDIGHYRVIRGYDENGFIQDDSLQGKNLRYTVSRLNEIWKPFNYEYLVISTEEIADIPDSKTAWQNTKNRLIIQSNLDMYDYFNLSVAEYYLDDYQASIDNFEKVESQLPMRMLWYQIEPIQAYFRIGQYDRVMQLTEKILINHNRAFSELYDLRGQVYLKRNNSEAARSEFDKAILYNSNYDL